MQHEFYMIMNKNTRGIVLSWLERSQGKNVKLSVFDKFISLWISFNSWGTAKYNTDLDRNIIDRFSRDEEIKEIYKDLLNNRTDKNFKENIRSLKQQCPIQKNRGGKVNIHNLFALCEVIEAIYTIRCNLIHGEKAPNVLRDKTLVSLAYPILTELFTCILKKEGLLTNLERN